MPIFRSIRPIFRPASLIGSLIASLGSMRRLSQSMTDRSVTLTVSILAGLAAAAFALPPPVALYFASYSHLQGMLETSARLHATEVMVMARQTPSFWKFNGLRVAATVSANQAQAEPERRRVFDRTGRLVVESVPSEPLAWPVIARRAPVMDGDERLGQAEAARSFRAQLVMIAIVAAACAVGGGVLFAAMRMIPLHLLHQALERARYLSAHDVLTGLPNRSLFGDRLRQALAASRRDTSSVAVMCLDLDRFKEVNDTLGHAAGDMLLRSVSSRLQACLREGDTLARLGGDEFAVIQVRAGQPQGAQLLASRLIAALEAPVILNDAQASVGVSIGIAVCEGGEEAGQMLKDADVALYHAKDSGRGRYSFFAPAMNVRLHERREMEADLRAALANDGLRLLYQPQVDAWSGCVTSAEAHLRWIRPGHGLVPTDRLIGFAEEIGLIGAMGNWMVMEACRAAASWPDPIGVAINVSPLQFRLPGFHETLRAALRKSGLAPARLEIEITESVLLHDTDDTLAALKRLRALGVSIAMDHFGTGYSSLGYLRKFRFDKIKIDRSFVQHLDDDSEAVAIVRAVVAMGAALGVTTNAEGVDTSAHAACARIEGCTQVQGGLYGEPMPAHEFEKFVARGRVPAYVQA